MTQDSEPTADRRTLLAALSLLLLPVPAQAFTPAGRLGRVWPGDYSGAVSLTYDDGLNGQLDIAVPALNQRGIKATFFVTMDNIRERLADWEKLPVEGHELADHTVTHPCDLRPFSASSYARRELLPMEHWLRHVEPGRRAPSFAYPCDVTNLGPGNANAQERRFDRLLARIGIQAARTSQGEPNRPVTALSRPHRLQALAVGYDARDFAAVDAYLGQAAAKGYWAILVFHDIVVKPTQEGETSDALHREILDSLTAHRLWTAPLGAVFDWLKRNH